MAEPEAMEPTTDRRAVYRDVMKPRQFQAQLIQGQIAPLPQTGAHPGRQAVQLAGPSQIALPLGQKRAGLPAQLDHVIDEFRRNPEMPGRLPVTMTFVNKRDNTVSQLNRMWLTHQ